jgi:hypothetical protein
VDFDVGQECVGNAPRVQQRRLEADAHEVKKCTDKMFLTVADAGKDSSTFAPLIVVQPVQNRSLDGSLRQLRERVLVDRPLDEAIPQKHAVPNSKSSIAVS